MSVMCLSACCCNSSKILNIKQIVQQFYSRLIMITMCFIYLNIRQEFLFQFMESHLVITHKGKHILCRYFLRIKKAVNP